MTKNNTDYEVGYDCPKCLSENTETWLFERTQNCLDCKHEFPLSEKLAQELKQARGVETYIMVWQGEEEKWHYFIDEFDKDQFADGYVDYYVEVEEGLISVDTYSPTNEDKVFSQAYDITLWENGSKMNITNMIVNKFDEEETDLVVEVDFSDERKEMDEPTFTVAIQNNAITSIISDAGQGDTEFDFSAEEERQVRKYVSDNYSF